MFRILTFYLTVIILFSISCSSLVKVKRLENCEFAFSHVSNIILSGIPLQDKKSIKDFNFAELALVSKSFISKKLPLSFVAHISIKNPNTKGAMLTKLEWIFIVDDEQVAEGTINQKYEIEGLSTISIPVNASLDLFNICQHKNKDAILKQFFNLSDENGKPIALKIKIKPILSIGKKEIKTPNYFTINSEFTFQDVK